MVRSSARRHSQRAEESDRALDAPKKHDSSRSTAMTQVAVESKIALDIVSPN